MSQLYCRYMSDLHMDVAKFNMHECKDDETTVLLLAGDLAEGKFARKFIEDCSARFRHVMYTPGNHEFFNREYYALINDWKEVADKIENFTFLQDESVMIDDVKFMGGTMWTDLRGRCPNAMNRYQFGLNDCKRIKIVNPELDSRKMYKTMKKKGRFWLAEDSVQAFEKTVDFFKNELNSNRGGKNVVMSHHCPSILGLHPHYRKTSDLNDSYYADVEYLFEDYDISAWVHGHTHHSQVYDINGVPVYSNARGYVPYESIERTGFNAARGFMV